MQWKVLSFLLLSAAILPTTLTYQTFQGYVPNGGNVMHPCPNWGYWPGVGHMNEGGRTALNPFGQDFRASGYEWTQELCRKDSDGDGLTNGQELGDPNCVWTVGSIAEKTTDISHPGFCNPDGTGNCDGQNVFDCGDEPTDTGDESKEPNCDYVDEKNVMTMDLRFQETTLPAEQTIYLCQSFDLPVDKDYHIIAFEPLIANEEAVHHMILYGCESNDTKRFNEPGLCGMTGDDDDKCEAMMNTWTLGLNRVCYGNNTGFLVGTNGYKLVKLEIHYNNPLKWAGMTDTSGLKLFYQEARPEVQSLATFTLGQDMIEIPPGQPRHEEVGICSGLCTDYFITGRLYVAAALNHMHALGTEMKVEVFRYGSLFKTLTHDEKYDYNAPKYYRYSPPIELQKGDEIKTTCIYNSMGQSRYVHYGDATSDEMCFAFLIVYPSSSLASLPAYCTARGPLDTCQLYAGMPYGNCNWAAFVNLSMPESAQRYMALHKNCNLDGLCRDECKPVIEEIKSHPCMNGEIAQIINWVLSTYKEGIEFLARLNSCPMSEDKADCRQDCAEYCWGDGSGITNGAVARIFKKELVLIVFAVAMKFLIGRLD